ncbi:MAG: secondary thiamine-phosphate synthase enzyme YjbQ [Acidobacteria bacterium]|nr:secondary thiamine-phosphate synthase enzyme YjbQ [Acidobacteriota bacterium]MCA1612156.1 secondary thiamine-phosphate synthase enzyme YjbQ [Acidobacteriota bacterium]
MTEFHVRTKKKIERRDITDLVVAAARALGVSSGAILVSVPHTTAAITVGENYDPDVTTDLERAWAKWVPDVPFDHEEGNSAAHFLSEAIGTSRLVPVDDGEPKLGRWQGIFLVELDGPRERTIEVTALTGSENGKRKTGNE